MARLIARRPQHLHPAALGRRDRAAHDVQRQCAARGIVYLRELARVTAAQQHYPAIGSLQHARVVRTGRQPRLHQHAAAHQPRNARRAVARYQIQLASARAASTPMRRGDISTSITDSGQATIYISSIGSEPGAM